MKICTSLSSKISSDQLPRASATFYNAAKGIDRTTTFFMNEFNTIEDNRDPLSTPSKYIAKLKQIQSFPGNNNLKQEIRLESHFRNAPDLAYVRSSIDTLASTGLPIWITELDIASAFGLQVIKMLKIGRASCRERVLMSV